MLSWPVVHGTPYIVWSLIRHGFLLFLIPGHGETGDQTSLIVNPGPSSCLKDITSWTRILYYMSLLSFTSPVTSYKDINEREVVTGVVKESDMVSS